MNTTKNRRLRGLVLTVLALGMTTPLLFPVPTPSPFGLRTVQAQSCSPYGTLYLSGSTYYDWIANGLPSNSSCWSTSNASFVSGTTTCGWTANAWEFYYAGSISQQFTIPSDKTTTNFSIQYLVDFIDPNNDGAWNRFSMEVRDVTTNTILASDFFAGSMGDLYCSMRSSTWNQNLAGHTIRVRFTGSRGYPDTYIRVRNIRLFQRIS